MNPIPQTSTLKKAAFVVVVAFVGLRVIRAVGNAMQKSTNTTVVKAGTLLNG